MKIKISKIVRDGAFSVADTYLRPRQYVFTAGFSSDNEKLRGDVQRLGNDMKVAIRKHGKQSYPTSRD